MHSYRTESNQNDAPITFMLWGLDERSRLPLPMLIPDKSQQVAVKPVHVGNKKPVCRAIVNL